eukprot:jgi/Tetstr1/455444/TSEL_042273.t1
MQGGALRLAARNAAVSAATAPPAGRAGVTWRRAGTMRILAPPGGAISAKLGGQRAALPRKQSRLRVADEETGSTVETAEGGAGSGSKDVFLDVAKAEEGNRLFSNLDPDTMRHQPGSLMGAISLVAGTTVGAGILALPNTTAPAGFTASAVALSGGAGYAMVTALLLAEVNMNTMCDLGGGGVSIVSMASRTLGKTGTRVASAAYLFLHYCLLVAYMSRAGEALDGMVGMPPWLGSLSFAGVLGAMCYFSSTIVLDTINNTLFAGVLLSFGVLTSAAIFEVDPAELAKANWEEVPGTLPVIALAFVFQNVVPVIVTNLEGDIGKVRQAIVLGTLLPFGMFLAWEAAILGNTGSISAGNDPVQALQLAKPSLSLAVNAFSFLAVATSFIGFVLGLSDFIADGMQLRSGRQQPVPYLATLVPPYILAMLFPGVFFSALDAAGTYGVLVLFGLMPAWMVWQERYGSTLPPAADIRIVPGGKAMLCGVGGAATLVILNSAVASLTN